MKIERKFHKEAQFDKPSNMHFLLRIDDLKKVKEWSNEDFDYAIKMLENDCIKDIQRQVKLMKEARQIQPTSGHRVFNPPYTGAENNIG